jgi:hypothetical protein
MFFELEKEEFIIFDIAEEKYNNLKQLFNSYITLDEEKWSFLKSNIILKYYDVNTKIDYNREFKDSFIYLNSGIVQGLQNNTGKTWYLYFNHPDIQYEDCSHNVIQDFFHYIFHEMSNISFVTLSECEVLYIRYEVLEEFFVKFYSYELFKSMISDIELKRVNTQIDEHSDKKMYENLYNYLADNKKLSSCENI